MIHSQSHKSIVLFNSGITDAATQSAAYEWSGYDHATLLFSFRAEETTHAADSTLSLLHSDDTVVTNHATFVANRSLDLTSAHQVRYDINRQGKKRYLRVTLTAGTTTGGNISCAAIAILSRGDFSPASTANMIGSTNDAVVVVS